MTHFPECEIFLRSAAARRLSLLATLVAEDVDELLGLTQLATGIGREITEMQRLQSGLLEARTMNQIFPDVSCVLLRGSHVRRLEGQ